MLKNIILRCLCQTNIFQKKKSNLDATKSIRFLTAKLHNTKIVKLPESHEKRSNPINRFANRTHNCGELTIENVNEKVKLCGWLQFQRAARIIVLRDSYGSTQCIVTEESKVLYEKLKNLSLETVLCIEGSVIPRPKNQNNPKMKTGEIEVNLESVEILNSAKSQLPFQLREYHKAKESLQMKYRYLSLRFPELQKNLRLRSWVTMKMREHLINKCGFIDVATPTLFRRTPGGAQEFVVPTRLEGKFYSLVQSPQQFKQLMMVGGIDKYFQIAQCYRDEGARFDRQPEFSQLDIEMSFVDRESLMHLVEELIINSWPNSSGYILQVPFSRLTFEETMENYGTDCPDLRLPGKIYNISKLIQSCDSNSEEPVYYATVFHGKQVFLTKSTKEYLSNTAEVSKEIKLIQLKVTDLELPELKNYFTLQERKDIINTLKININDVFLMTCGPKMKARATLGKLRVEFANILESKGDSIRSSGYKFVWIVDFPLFTENPETKEIECSHHPFTQPHADDIHHLYSKPLEVRGLQYDLVLNGSEIGGGSIRVHQKSLQEDIFKMLNIDPNEMYYLLDALESGAPPHGGIALGLDRYISLLCGATSLRDVIAFPKTIEGRDLMSGAPTEISEHDQYLYHIKVSNKNLDRKLDTKQLMKM